MFECQFVDLLLKCKNNNKTRGFCSAVRSPVAPAFKHAGNHNSGSCLAPAISPGKSQILTGGMKQNSIWHGG